MAAALHGPSDAPKVAPNDTGLRETAYAMVVAAVVVCLIYFGRPLLVPLALSIQWPSRWRRWSNFCAV